MLPIKVYIDSVIHTANENGVAIFVVRRGDVDRGDLFVKTESDNNTYAIHHRSYDLFTDSYIWHTKTYESESTADTTLNHHHAQDPDCWCIDIYATKNYFADIL